MVGLLATYATAHAAILHQFVFVLVVAVFIASSSILSRMVVIIVKHTCDLNAMFGFIIGFGFVLVFRPRVRFDVDVGSVPLARRAVTYLELLAVLARPGATDSPPHTPRARHGTGGRRDAGDVIEPSVAAVTEKEFAGMPCVEAGREE